jgi:hypothetical protein
MFLFKRSINLVFFSPGVKWLDVNLAPRLRVSGAMHLLLPACLHGVDRYSLPLHMFHVILTVNTDSCPVQL